MAAELQSFYRELEARVAEQSKRLAASERLASVGFLAAGVAHEINNPLSIMSGHAESLLRRLKDHPNSDCSSEEVRQSLDIIRDEAFRCKQITQGLLDLSRKRDEEPERVSIWRVVDDVVSLSKASAADRGVAISVNGDRSDALAVAGSAPELKQVLLNLIANAMDAAKSDAGGVEVRAGRANGCVELAVRDDGRGMTPETLAQVFEPFFTLSKGRGGIGLGLAISQAIVEKHHGTLEAASDGPDCGSVFTLRLPAETEAPA
jgi:signal transduction histidine kinase